MSRVKRSELEVDAIREKIINAALQIMSESGFEAISIRSIADKVGMSHMTLYTYFENRQALIKALMMKQHKKMLSQQDSILEEARTGDFGEILDGIFSRMQKFAIQKNNLRLLWASGEKAPVKHNSRNESHLISPPTDFLSEIIQMGIQKKVLYDRDPEIAANLIFGLLNGPLFVYHTKQENRPEFAESLMKESRELAKAYLIKDYKLP